jgi:hypothetical protein
MSLWILLLVVLLVAPFVLVAACGRSFLYYPTRTSDAELARLAAVPGWQRARLPVAATITLEGLVRPPPAAATGRTWLLFFGGNAMDLASSQWVLDRLGGERPVGLAAFAYRGYDGSGGAPSEDALCGDSEAIAESLAQAHGVAAGDLVLVGQSLGTGVAVHLAATLTGRGEPPAGIILVSPYTSMARVFDDHVPLLPVAWAVADSYRTDRRLAQLRAPILILHGVADEVIDVAHGRAIAAALGERASLVELPGTHHNDVWAEPAAVGAAQAFIDALRVAAGAPGRR